MSAACVLVNASGGNFTQVFNSDIARGFEFTATCYMFYGINLSMRFNA
jgi:hypothetical protein